MARSPSRHRGEKPMDFIKSCSRKSMIMWIVLILVMLPWILKLMNPLMGNSCMNSTLKQILSSYLPGNYNSIRYLLSAIIQSAAAILALILTLPLILLQSMYKHARITEFFVRRKEIWLFLLFASYLIIVSTITLSMITDKSDLTGIIYFLAHYSILLFALLFLCIYAYWRFCAGFFSSKGALDIIEEVRSHDRDALLEIMEVLLEVLKKAIDEGSIRSINRGCDGIRNILEQEYPKFEIEDRESILRGLKDVAGKSIESGPETLKPFTNIFVDFMRLGVVHNEELSHFERIFEFVEPVIVESVGMEQVEALDNYRLQLDGLRNFIIGIQGPIAADYIVAIENHWNRIVIASLDRVLGGMT